MMRVVVATEHHFARVPDGSVYSLTGGREYRFWSRYLDVFSGVIVLGRVRDQSVPPSSEARANGPGVVFHGVPDYQGPAEFLRTLASTMRAVNGAYRSDHAYIVRGPGALGVLLGRTLRRKRHPYGLEVVGDPYDVFAPGAVKSPLRRFLRRGFTAQLRNMTRHAAAVAYVTEQTLQRRYPAGEHAFTTHYSSVELPSSAFVSEARTQRHEQSSLSIIAIGSLEQPYKGIDVLIDAVARCRQHGLEVMATIVGDGRYRTELEQQATRLGLADQVRFLGQLPAGEAVRNQIDAADLFVLPSRTEGLPRAMIEAMARGLPCLGSAVGGIPELLPPEDLVPPDRADALSEKILEVVRLPGRMSEMSRRNRLTAKKFADDELRSRRVAFYAHVQESTLAWLQNIPK